jgi:hypothetical protein
MPASGIFLSNHAHMQLFLDESGDLGWAFDKKYREGGSSRYLTLAFMFLPPEYRNEPKNVIRFLYKKYGWKGEKKAQSATLNQKLLFCEKAIALFKTHKEIKIDIITVKKENVQDHIRQDANKLYNYMASLVISDYTEKMDTIHFIPDERTVKVKSGNSLVDFLQTKLWFDLGHKTKILNSPSRSFQQYNLQFVDWIANCIWSNFEDSIEEPYQLLYPYIKHRKLFFVEAALT